MINFRNTTDGIGLIKFCFDLNDLTDFKISLNDESEGENENDSENMESTEAVFESDQMVSLNSLMLNYIVFMIKIDSISFSSQTPHESIRNALKKNYMLSNVWHISILYVINLFTLPKKGNHK